MKKSAVVILNWNGREHLEQFLPSVVAHTPAAAEIIVADNGSTDSSVEFVRQQSVAIRRRTGIAVNGTRQLADLLKQLEDIIHLMTGIVIFFLQIFL